MKMKVVEWMGKKVTDKLHKKRNTISKSEKMAVPKTPKLTETGDIFEKRIEYSITAYEYKESKATQRKNLAAKIVRGLLVACSVYLAFLIYGVINTQYVYNAEQKVIPLIMTYDQIENLDNFCKLSVQYRQARTLYEQVLVLDYRVKADIEDSLTIAPEYEKLLTSIESLAIQLNAIEIPAEFAQIKNMLLTWTKNDIAVYCQNISRAISQNNQEYFTRAEEYKVLMYQDFSVVTQNLISLGMQVDGVDLQDIMAWSPEKHIEKAIGAFNGGEQDGE